MLLTSTEIKNITYHSANHNTLDFDSPLKKYLKTLSAEKVREVELLFYLGKRYNENLTDDSLSPLEAYNSLCKTLGVDDTDITIYNLLSKPTFSSNFKTGCSKLGLI